MDIPELLGTTKAYLEELSNFDDEDGVYVEPAVLTALDERRADARMQLEGDYWGG